MAYNEQLFKDRVDRMNENDVLFETLGTAFIKCDDGRLWAVGTNMPFSSEIADVAEYVYTLESVIEAADQWNLDENQLKDEIKRIRDEIADYEVD